MGFDLQNLESSSSKEFPRAPTRSHKLKMLRGLVFQFRANMLVILEHEPNHSIHRAPIYKTWKFQAQAIINALPRATRTYGNHQRHFTRSHVPTPATFIITRAPTRHALTHAPSAMTSWMMSSSVPGLTRTDPKIWPGPNRLPKKKKRKRKRKRKGFDQVEL